MKTTTLVLGCLLLTGPAATAQTFRWVRTGGSSRLVAATLGVAAGAGRVVTTGWFEQTADFGGQSLSTYGPYDTNAFTGQLLAATGATDWLASQGGPTANNIVMSAAGYAAGLDATGNSYVAYSINAECIFGSITVPGSGDPNVPVPVLVKYAPSGSVLWTKRLPGSLRAELTALAVRPDGTCYVTGNFAGSLPLDGITLSSTAPANVQRLNGFVARLSATGSVQWAQALNSTGSLACTSLAVDATGAACVGGTFYTNAYLGAGLSLTARDQGNGGYGDGFVVRYDAGGVSQWVQQLGARDGDETTAVAADAAGNVFVAGTFGHNQLLQSQASPITIGTTTLYTTASIGYYHRDAYLAKLTAQGEVSWVSGIQGGDFEQPQALATSAGGDCYVSGYGYNGLQFGSSPAGLLTGSTAGYIGFVAKYSPLGNVNWLTSYAGHLDNTHAGTALATDGLGHLYVGGEFHDQAVSFGNVSATGAVAATTAFVAALDDAQLLPTRPVSTANALQVYPNPTSGPLQLSWPAAWQPGSLAILDILGRSVRRQSLMPGSDGLLLDLTGLPAGVYWLRLHSSGQPPLTKQVVRQ